MSLLKKFKILNRVPRYLYDTAVAPSRFPIPPPRTAVVLSSHLRIIIMSEGGKGGFGSAEEAWWAVLRDLGPGHDESIVPGALVALRDAVRPPLPKMVRPDMVRDVCSFLVAPSEKVSLARLGDDGA